MKLPNVSRPASQSLPFPPLLLANNGQPYIDRLTWHWLVVTGYTGRGALLDMEIENQLLGTFIFYLANMLPAVIAVMMEMIKIWLR